MNQKLPDGKDAEITAHPFPYKDEGAATTGLGALLAGIKLDN